MKTNLEEYADPYLYEAEYGHYTGDFDFFLNLIQTGDVQVYGKQQADISHSIVTYITKRVWKDKETQTVIQLRFTSYELLIKLLTHSGLKVLEVYGDDQKNAFQKESPSIFLICAVEP